jgi:glutamyl-tRNA reductase
MFLKKHGFSNFTVFNRSIVNANKLAMELEGKSHKLSELKDFNGGFDVLLTCTSAEHSIIDLPLYTKLLQGDTDKKTLIDIAIPQDIDPAVIQEHNVNYVSINYLQKVSEENQKVRGEEVLQVKEIVKSALISFVKLMEERSVEIAMKDVPAQIKQIRNSAVNEVFKNDIDNLDPETREVLDKVLGYVEKKYISGPMKLAKEIILKNASN